MICVFAQQNNQVIWTLKLSFIFSVLLLYVYAHALSLCVHIYTHSYMLICMHASVWNVMPITDLTFTAKPNSQMQNVKVNFCPNPPVVGQNITVDLSGIIS